LLFLANINGFRPAPGDIYNPDAENRGNSNYNPNIVRDGDNVDENIYFSINWDNAREMNEVDMRLFYVEKDNDTQEKYNGDAW